MKKPRDLIASLWQSAVEADVVLKDYKCFKDFQCSTQGYVSTPSTDNMADTFESISSANQLHLHYDSIKLTLEELSKFSSNQFIMPIDIEWHSISGGTLSDVFRDANDTEINIGFLWAAFLKRWDLFGGFLELGAQLSFYEHNYGLTALHLVAFSGCKKSTEYLLAQKGGFVNLMCKCYSPLHCATFGDSSKVAAFLLENGANIDAFTNDLHCNLEGVLHCAVRANAVNCLKLFCDKEANINQLDSSGRTPLHLAAELGHVECLRVLVEAKNANIDQQTNEKQQSALHFAAQKRHPDCVEILLDHGATANITDYRQHTPVHLAAKSQCNDCVKILLRKGQANPNLQDADQRTAMHLAVSNINRINASDTIKTLKWYGADINPRDRQGLTPLHLAAQNELSECVETLILCDADITAKCKRGITALGVISSKTPCSIDSIRKKLDESIVFNHHESNKKELDLQIDFTTILQHCHPRETAFLSTLLDEGQKELLLHPICMAFLHLKWRKIRKFFIFRAVFCFLLAVTMSGYVILGLAKHCYNFSQNMTLTSYEEDKELCLNHSFSGYFVTKYPYVIELEWYLLVLLSFGIILRKLCGIAGYTSFSQYVCSVENILDWSTVVTVYLISFAYTGRTYIWQNHVSAFGVLLIWINFLYLLGQFPFFGTYIAMYCSVQQEFAKLLLVFSCLLIGFTVSFCVLFPNSDLFSNIFIGFISVLVMAIGEMNLELVTQPTKGDKAFMLRGSTETIYTIFVTCVTIILLNLLVGIAVHDIQGLKKTAKLTKLIKATKLIYGIEMAFFTDYFHKKILFDVFRWSTLVSTKGYCVLNVNLHKRQDRILPRDIIQSACEVARKHKKKNKNSNFRKISYHDNHKTSNIKNQIKRNFGEWNVENDLNNIKNDLRNLNNEVITIRNMLESNERLMEQILRMLSANEES